MILHDMYPPYIRSWAYLRKPTYVSSPPRAGCKNETIDINTATTQRRRNGNATAHWRRDPVRQDPVTAKVPGTSTWNPWKLSCARHLTDSLRKQDSHKLLDNDIDGQLIKALTQEWNDGTRILRCDWMARHVWLTRHMVNVYKCTVSQNLKH